MPEWFGAAYNASHIPIAISDACLPENPLVYVNPAFVELTGYDADRCVGKNCRFLQCEETDARDKRVISEAITTRVSIEGVILNERADGGRFTNVVILKPVTRFDDSCFVIGCLLDATRLGPIEALRERLDRRRRSDFRDDTDLIGSMLRGNRSRANSIFLKFESRLLQQHSADQRNAARGGAKRVSRPQGD